MVKECTVNFEKTEINTIVYYRYPIFFCSNNLFDWKGAIYSEFDPERQLVDKPFYVSVLNSCRKGFTAFETRLPTPGFCNMTMPTAFQI